MRQNNQFGWGLVINQSNIITRRRFPRVDATLSVEVRAECGLTFSAVTKNISQIGLLFVTDEKRFKQLTLNQRSSETRQPVEVDVNIMLPMASETPIELFAHCRVFQLRRVSSDCFYIGLEYVGLSEENYNNLSQYIEGIATRSEGWSLRQ